MANPANLNPILQPARLVVPNPVPIPNVPRPAPRYAIDANVGFLDRGKIPSIIKDLPDFNGNARDLSTWILDVEDCLELFNDFRDSYEYHLVMKTVRRKIKNEANDILISNNTPNDWSEIKDVLRLYYADKRDLMTLDNQLKVMSRRPQETIETYYSRVREMITLISSAISTDETWKGHEAALIKLYNMMALDTFIRGLGEPLSLFCKNYKPKSLASAYHYCVEFLNLNARSAPFKSNPLAPIPAPRGNIPVPPPRPVPTNRYHPNAPPPPPRNHYQPPPVNFRQPYPVQTNHQTPFQTHSHNKQPYSFQTQHQPPFRPQNTNVFAPNRTFYQQQPKPEPMDIDKSIQSRMLNYGNRPNFKTARPTSESMQANNPPTKRVAHQLEDISREDYDEPDEVNLNFAEEIETFELQELTGLQDEENETNVNFLENDTEWVSKWFD